MLVDTYGIPWYKEINPTILLQVYFPFMFGVMFGDVFHGSILIGVSVFVIVQRFNMLY